MASEFALIRRHFTRPARHTDLSVGDDAALIRPAAGMQLAISTDMLVAGTHFFADTDPRDLGWKTLAVNVSDLAAMGATPRWVVLAASLPAADEAWVAAFAEGFFACCEAFGVDAIGGDTTRGPLNLCPTVFGEVPVGQAVLRSGELVEQRTVERHAARRGVAGLQVEATFDLAAAEARGDALADRGLRGAQVVDDAEAEIEIARVDAAQLEMKADTTQVSRLNRETCHALDHGALRGPRPIG